MNYYERYCGDYARDTARLTVTEHGAYTLMLDEYYSTESPLPEPYDELYRLCRAMSTLEQAAVRKVADKHFPVGADGMRHNKRADEDIAKAQKRINAARVNGAKNAKTETTEPQQTTQPIPNGIPSGLPNSPPDRQPPGDPKTHPSGTYGEASTRHTPDPIHQTPTPDPTPHTPPTPSPSAQASGEKPNPSALARGREPPPAFAPPQWVPAEAWEDFDEMRRRKSGKAWTLRARELAVLELDKLRAQGYDPAEVLQQSVIRSWAGLFPVDGPRRNGSAQPTSDPNLAGLSPAGQQTAAMLAEWVREGADPDAAH